MWRSACKLAAFALLFCMGFVQAFSPIARVCFVCVCLFVAFVQSAMGVIGSAPPVQLPPGMFCFLVYSLFVNVLLFSV